jgi:hypothetical protein
MKVLGLIFSTASGRVRVAVRLRPRNAEDIVSDADFSVCVELQRDVFYMSHSKITLMLNLSLSLSLSLSLTHTHTHTHTHVLCFEQTLPTRTFGLIEWFFFFMLVASM